MVDPILEGTAFGIVIAQLRTLLDRPVRIELQIAEPYTRLMPVIVTDRCCLDVEIEVVVLAVTLCELCAGLNAAIARCVCPPRTTIVSPVLEGTAFGIVVAQLRTLL